MQSRQTNGPNKLPEKATAPVSAFIVQPIAAKPTGKVQAHPEIVSPPPPAPIATVQEKTAPVAQRIVPVANTPTRIAGQWRSIGG